MKWIVKHVVLSLIVLLWLSACKENIAEQSTEQTEESVAVAPEFSADSAYWFIQQQVAFGPRVPGTPEHAACADWLINELTRFGAKVTVQRTTVKAHDGKILPCINIIGSYQPDAAKRLLLCAHWDTRPRADQDVQNQDKPIDGANDGASGVGVLLEIARQLQKEAPATGVDIIFFDVEDYGVSGVEDSYCLGSQYWGKNPHTPGYQASNGILLDMVGSKDARFTMEGSSMQIAPEFVREIWRTGHALGHGQFFLFRETSPIIDDHVYVYQLTRIPIIDIIHFDATTPSGFGKYWHTHADNMDIISTITLKAVGETVLSVTRSY